VQVFCLAFRGWVSLGLFPWVLGSVGKQCRRHLAASIRFGNGGHDCLGNGFTVGHDHLSHKRAFKFFDAALDRFQLGLDTERQCPPALTAGLFPRTCDSTSPGTSRSASGRLGKIAKHGQWQDKAHVSIAHLEPSLALNASRARTRLHRIFARAARSRFSSYRRGLEFAPHISLVVYPFRRDAFRRPQPGSATLLPQKLNPIL
jgi:hypothetical protein